MIIQTILGKGVWLLRSQRTIEICVLLILTIIIQAQARTIYEQEKEIKWLRLMNQFMNRQLHPRRTAEHQRPHQRM